MSSKIRRARAQNITANVKKKEKRKHKASPPSRAAFCCLHQFFSVHFLWQYLYIYLEMLLRYKMRLSVLHCKSIFRYMIIWKINILNTFTLDYYILHYWFVLNCILPSFLITLISWPDTSNFLVPDTNALAPLFCWCEYYQPAIYKRIVKWTQGW